MMKPAIRLGAAAILSLVSLVQTQAAPAGAETPACKLLSINWLKPLLGEPVAIRETNNPTSGVSNCFWRGAKDGVHVGLHFITFASQKVQGGNALQYFQQSAASQKERIGVQHFMDIAGLGQAAFMLNPEVNPSQAVTITFLQNDDTVTLETYGLGAAAAEALAKNIAAAMKR